jgi:uncharacterized membrane protein
MAKVERSIDVEVPVQVAYNQWTQFEEFPEFMDSVEQVRQVDDTHLHWTADVAGKRKEWDAEITEQTPDQRIAWTSTTGARNAGAVSFHRIDDNKSRVLLTMDVEPEGIIETAGTAAGIFERSVQNDLESFKKFVESRGAETGAWRGEVEQTKVR